MPLNTETKFIILMHPKEFKKTKNGTGHFTNLSLTNCEIHVGVDFSQNDTINEMINNPFNPCYVLYPSKTSINLNESAIGDKGENTVLFLIDSTWSCSRSILLHSPNIQKLEKVSFTHTQVSGFTFKQQPKEYYLSTMESTLCVLELLTEHKLEDLERKALMAFYFPLKRWLSINSLVNKL